MCSLFLFGHPLLRAGRCLFLETLFSAILGVPRARPTPGASPPRPPPTPDSGPPPWVVCPAHGHPSSLLAALASRVCFLPAGPVSVRSWRGGPAPARKLESFVLAPRPARGGVGMGGRAGEASGGPGPGSGPGSRLLSAFPPELGLRAPGGV